MKTKYNIILALAAVVMPLSLANAATTGSYQFNGSSSNQVGGSPGSLGTFNPGDTISVSLQVNLDAAQSTSAVDYWLTNTGGSSVLSITNRDYTSSQFGDPSATNAQVTSTGDTFNNSTGAPSSPDGVADNLLNPRNGPDLGSSTTDLSTKTGAGTFQVANFMLQIAGSAAPGTYQLQTFDYSGFGINDTTPTAQAAINFTVGVVPEPATWSLMGLGGLGSIGLTWLRARRKSA